MQGKAQTMTKCSIAELSDRGVIKIHGSDAHKLLQDIVTNDITKARDGRAIHAALLTPQGKILFDFFLIDRGDDLLLECARDVIPELLKRLTFYKLRADVTFEDISETNTVWASWGETSAFDDNALAYADPRAAGLGYRIVATSGSNPCETCNEATRNDYHAHRIGLGVPESGLDYLLGDTFPHEADYDQLHGVDFKKGCYVGQEVVSRMQHRGTARKRIVPVTGVKGLASGETITAGDATIGTLGSVSGDRGLAMIRLDRVEKAVEDGRTLTIGSAEIYLRQPEWAGFQVPTGGHSK